MMTIARALLLSTVMVSAPLVAAHGAPPADPPTRAKARYDLGMTAYRLGYYDQAIGAFTRARAIDPTPNLLYNIAQSYWKKGDKAQALAYYRRYLDATPGAPIGSSSRADPHAVGAVEVGTRRRRNGTTPPGLPPRRTRPLQTRPRRGREASGTGSPAHLRPPGRRALRCLRPRRLLLRQRTRL